MADLELELGISELAALRPIRTGADVGDGDTGCCFVAPLTTTAVDASDDGTGCCVVATITMTAVDASDDVGEFMEPRKDGGVGDDAAGCVTPTAVDASDDGTGCCVVAPLTMMAVDASDDDVGELMEPRKDGGVVDGAAGCVTPTARRDGGAEEDGADSDVCFVTPISASSVLAQPTVCPPAPRKQGPAKRKICGRGTPRRFFFSVPRDLDAVFVPTAAPSPPLTPPAAASKKSRVHVVG